MAISRPLIGAALMTTALMLNGVKDGFAKLLSGSYEPLMLLWMQVLFACLVLLPVIVSRYGLSILLPRPLGLQIARAAVLIIGVGCFYWAVRFISLADATAMIFLAPLVVTALSPLVLGEALGARRTIAVIIGFLGILLILRPAFDGDPKGYIIGLAAGFSIGLFYIANRKLAPLTPQIVAAAYPPLIGAILIAPLAPFFWTTPVIADGGLIAAFLVLATLGQVMMISAFAYAPANIIAPFQYSQIIGAIAFSVIVFGDFPGPWTWSGIALIAGAGIYIAVRETRIKGRAVPGTENMLPS
jgi:drug/metabolite transporter (DMT)-like permease